MDQPTPNVTDADVERVVRRDFPAEHHAQIIALLSEYGKEDWHQEPARVRLAALKFADGNLDKLRNSVGAAVGDFRDVLSIAEYPAYSRAFFHLEKMPRRERAKREKQLFEQDWKQYESWLYR